MIGLVWSLFWLASAVNISAQAAGVEQQQPLDGHKHKTPTPSSVSVSLFASLERLARLVDISYCIGSTGVRKPFECISRCSEFPNLSLSTTWSTGILMSDSCGYIAVDHGGPQTGAGGYGGAADSSQGAIIVAFRGTYSLTNTIIDLSSVPQQYVPYPSPDDGAGEESRRPHRECTNCTVHMGFLDSWRNARRQVLPELISLRDQYPSYPIHLVGHSLGGSVACLAALELKVSLGWDGVLVTTFGEPRVGNYGLARFIDEVFDLDGDEDLERRTYRRVTHSNDPVPLLPLEEWGYRSHSGEIYISKSDLSPSEEDVQVCVGDNDPSCSGGADASSQAFGHSPDNAASGPSQSTSSWRVAGIPTRLKLWELFFAHRDYFWRLGLCVPGGDPANWGRHRYEGVDPDEL